MDAKKTADKWAEKERIGRALNAIRFCRRAQWRVDQIDWASLNDLTGDLYDEGEDELWHYALHGALADVLDGIKEFCPSLCPERVMPRAKDEVWTLLGAAEKRLRSRRAALPRGRRPEEGNGKGVRDE
jgi:hypothetical protein